MQTLESVMAELESLGKPTFLKTYIRHGIPAERTFGVSNADLKVLLKGLKGRQDLALELFATGNYDAMYLAGLIIDGKKMSKDELESWVNNMHGLTMIASYPVSWATIENPEGIKMAREWIKSEDPIIATAGWSAISDYAVVTPDDQLDLKMYEDLLDHVAANIHSAPNRPKNSMNTFLVTVGSYVMPLHEKAMAVANEIGVVTIDVGDTSCTTKVASEAIAKMAASGKLGVKRKTVRC